MAVTVAAILNFVGAFILLKVAATVAGRDRGVAAAEHDVARCRSPVPRPPRRPPRAPPHAFLGWFTGVTDTHREFYVRQLRDKKGSAEVELMSPASLAGYGELCGATLARAHARTGEAEVRRR